MHKKPVCPKCQAEVKQLKHSTLCKCGVKFKNIKTIA